MQVDGQLGKIKSLLEQLKKEERWELHELIKPVMFYSRGLISEDEFCGFVAERMYEFDSPLNRENDATEQHGPSPQELAREFVELGNKFFAELLSFMSKQIENASEDELTSHIKLPKPKVQLVGWEKFAQELQAESKRTAQRAMLRFIQIMRPILLEK